MKKQGISISGEKEDDLQAKGLIFGGGEMGNNIRSFEWKNTPLGPVTDWPQSLVSAVNLMLQSPAPMVILWGAEGITFYNNAYIPFAGKRHPVLLGNSCPEAWPEGADFMRNVIEKTLQGEPLSYKSLPYRVYRNNKAQDVWVDLDCSPLLDENAKPFATFIVNTETTKYVETLQKLKEREQRHNFILEGTTDGFYQMNLENRTSVWNERLWQILGYHQDEERRVAGYDFVMSILHPEDKGRIEKVLEYTIREGRPYDVEYRIRHRKGHYIYLHSKGKLVLDEQGQAVGIAGIAIDITQRKQMEEAQKASEERFRTMAEASGILVAQADEGGNAVYFNQEWLKLTGRSMQDLLQYGWSEFLHPEDREGFITAYQKAFEQREVLKTEFRLLSKEGAYRWQLAVVSPCFSPNGAFSGYVSSCVDISDLKWTQERLAYQSQLTKIITDNATVGLFMMDAKGRTTFMNPAAEQISGFSFEEARGEILHDLTHHLHPDGSPFPMQDCTIGQTVFALGELKNHEDVFIHKDGSFYPVLCSASAIWEKETLKGLILEVQDISEGKKAEEALKESEERFRSMADNISQCAWMADEKGWIYWYNQRWYDYTGTTLEEMQGWGWRKVHHPEHVERVVERIQYSWDTGEPWEDTFPLRGKDGNYRWFLSRALPIRNEEGKVIRWFGTNTDVTAQRELTEALKESEQRFRIMADAAPYVVWSLYPDASIRYINKYGLEFLGNRAEGFLAENWGEIIHPDDLQKSSESFEQAFRNKKNVRLEHRFLRHDGEYRWILSQGAPSYYPNGELFGYVGSCIDISERKQAEEDLEAKNVQLTRINNDLDNFIYTASHDLKAPIHNIEGLMKVLNNNLSQQLQNHPKIKSVMGMIHLSINRFQETIKDLTAIAKVESDGKEEVQEILFSEVLEEVKLNIHNQILESNARISADFSQAPSLLFSKKNLRSILYNLVSNAIKYRSPERAVDIRIATEVYDHHFMVLRVQDNGLGIKEADKPKIFTMFKRLHQHVEGSGVGMSIVKRILDNSGGKIEVESELGKGSVFKVFFKTSL